METRRDEREPYFLDWRRTLKGWAMSLGVAFVFYIFNLPDLHGAQAHVHYLVSCLIYGTVIYAFIWMMYVVQRFVTGKPAERKERGIPLKTQTFLSFVGTILGLFAAQHIDAWMSGTSFEYSQFWESIFLSVFVAMFFQFYYAWKHSQRENLELKAAKAETELHVLRNQMQPHFLFNSLNSLAALIDTDSATAGPATQKLADLYRLILDASKSSLSPIAREAQIAQLYLEIEKIRFGRRLNFLLPILSPSENDLLVPSLVIQTLVENAVKHGISGSLEGGFVHLTVSREPSGLRVTVLNSGAPLVEKKEGGTGLRNTEERLKLAFGPSHGFRLSLNAYGLTEATFLIPEKAWAT